MCGLSVDSCVWAFWALCGLVTWYMRGRRLAAREVYLCGSAWVSELCLVIPTLTWMAQCPVESINHVHLSLHHLLYQTVDNVYALMLWIIYIFFSCWNFIFGQIMSQFFWYRKLAIVERTHSQFSMHWKLLLLNTSITKC